MTSYLEDIQLILDNTRQFFHPGSTEYQQAAALEKSCSQVLLDYGFASSSHESESDSSESLQSPTELTLRIPTSRLSLSSRRHSGADSATPTLHSSTAPSSGSGPKVPTLKINLASIKADSKSEITTGEIRGSQEEAEVSVPKITIPKASASRGSTPKSSASKSSIRKGSTPTSSASKSSAAKIPDPEAWVQEYLASDDPVKKFMAAVFNFHDHSGDLVAEPFHQLPSREEYPEYYRVITQPIDLLIIQRNTEVRCVGGS